MSHEDHSDGGEFGLGGFSMFDLFRTEAETHTRTLNEGLLALESAPAELSAIEPLMRAAHSIKGAARIIGLDSAVRLAHAMEDVLVSAQKGRELVRSTRIDQLLAGTDLLNELANLSESDLSSWSDGNAKAIEELVALLGSPPPRVVDRSARFCSRQRRTGASRVACRHRGRNALRRRSQLSAGSRAENRSTRGRVGRPHDAAGRRDDHREPSRSGDARSA